MRWPWTPPERIEISKASWKELLAELAARGEGRRESGAFLLAPPNSRTVVDIGFYDSFDADCLQGNICFSAAGFSALFDCCREQGLRVIGDVHTHAGSSVKQSPEDKKHPMVALSGHVGLIVPSLAQSHVSRSDIGFHVYQGDRGWQAHFRRAARRRIGFR